MPERTSFMNVELSIATKSETLAAIESATPENPVRLATINPEFIVLAQKNSLFQKSLAEMTHCTLDGSGVYFAFLLYKLFGKIQIPFDHYPGADLAEDLFRRHQHGEKKFFFLGGQPGVAHQAAKNICRKYPQIKIIGTNDGGLIDPKNITVRQELVEELNSSKPDILMVCFGSPKQELWITAASKKLNLPTMIGLGGTFDFYVQKKRAPKWVRELHMEWLFRGITEPGHWKRVIQATIIFPFQSVRWLLHKGK